ncbi:DUF6896 domain-containing protein [Streptomyces avermitilis]|uniref:DUF6896 domain-containing protein n=1 Tax=Streptomyces avermitilis TaxID=33903 RepID=UPI0037FABCDB
MATARDLVIGYVDALSSAGEAMRAAFPSLERLADVLGLVRSHRISRSGEIGTYSYSVHGAGCLFINQDGSEIDVDFAADGRRSSTSGDCAFMGRVCLSLSTSRSMICGPRWSR